MSHHPFPDEVPLECVTEMFRLIRDQAVMDNLGEFLRHAYHVVGYGLYVFVGNEDAPPLIGTTAEQAEGPKQFLAAVASELAATPADAIKAVPWATLLPLVLRIAQMVFDRKQS